MPTWRPGLERRGDRTGTPQNLMVKMIAGLLQNARSLVEARILEESLPTFMRGTTGGPQDSLSKDTAVGVKLEEIDYYFKEERRNKLDMAFKIRAREILNSSIQEPINPEDPTLWPSGSETMKLRSRQLSERPARNFCSQRCDGGYCTCHRWPGHAGGLVSKPFEKRRLQSPRASMSSAAVAFPANARAPNSSSQETPPPPMVSGKPVDFRRQELSWQVLYQHERGMTPTADRRECVDGFMRILDNYSYRDCPSNAVVERHGGAVARQCEHDQLLGRHHAVVNVLEPGPAGPLVLYSICCPRQGYS
ncbi:hypothetical protein BJ875DRAFT_436689 [Amylocarpus encephaloides]|uniref:Uncharacterized protein n=1 Tax=Amylocarpus encephaloides TaxID=45428 RepID=A0A9P7YT47_9HELO|nr:hypothetical protein BJ875DRAFT_436689 [Amylocarpus encephaloides]